MALSASTVLEVRTTGSDTNGGGFVTGSSGTDWTQQNAAQYSVTDAVTNGTTTITSATANFGTDVVGNLLYIQGGTGAIVADWYQITGRTNTTTITVDRSTGLTTGTGAALKIGGALASPGIAAAIKAKTAGIKAFVKSGTYSITSTTANVSGGRISDSSGSTSEASTWFGYNSTRGDNGTPPVFQASGISTTTLFTLGSWCFASNIKVDGNNLTAIRGFEQGAYSGLYNCKVVNCKNNGISHSGEVCFTFLCEISGCTTAAAFVVAGRAMLCEVHDNVGVIGFSVSNNGSVYDSLSYRNSVGFANGNISVVVANCTSAFNSSHGFDSGSNQWLVNFVNCISYGNGGYGYNSSAPMKAAVLQNCAGGSNTSGNYNTSNYLNVANFVSLTANPFTNAVSTANGAADFSLNNTAGGGADCQAVGLFGTTPSGNAVGYTDIGPLQHQDAGGGGSASPFQLRGSGNITVF